MLYHWNFSVSRCSRCSLLGPLHRLPVVRCGVLLLRLLWPSPHWLCLDPGSHSGAGRGRHQPAACGAGCCCRCKLKPPYGHQTDRLWRHDPGHGQQNENRGTGLNSSGNASMVWCRIIIFVYCLMWRSGQYVVMHQTKTTYSILFSYRPFCFQLVINMHCVPF